MCRSKTQGTRCKDNASRTQSSLLGIAEAKLILCKDNGYFCKNRITNILIRRKGYINNVNSTNYTNHH